MLNLKDSLLGLRSKLDIIEKEIDNSANLKEEPEKDQKQEITKVRNTEEKIAELLDKDKIIKLNIGGKIFQTKVSTLKANPDTLFYKALQANEGTKELFFDRSFNFFPVILDFLIYKSINLKKFNKYDRQDIEDELQYYGIMEITNNKKVEVEIGWDQNNSKVGACTVSLEDNRNVRIHSTTCYTHFVTDKIWRDESFIIELDSTVTQTDNYYYIGLINEAYSLTGSCGCCNSANSFYLQCNGSFHMNSITTNDDNFNFGSQRIIIGMRVNLEEKQLYFYLPEKEGVEAGPFTLVGNTFRVYAGHCNAGNGDINILTCYEPKI